MIVIDDGSEYYEIEGQKVDEKVDFPIELQKSGQELPIEKVVRPKGNEKMVIDVKQKAERWRIKIKVELEETKRNQVELRK